MSMNNKTIEAVITVISGMFNPDENRVSCAATDWVDDSRLIGAMSRFKAN